MRKMLIVAIIIAAAAMILAWPVMAAITVDGDLSDWGLSQLQAGDLSQDSTWIPTETGIYYIIEDMHNPLHGGNYITGTHIKGTSGYASSFFDEPKLQLKDGTWVSPPYGGPEYDLKGYYFQQDADNIYVAIITAVAPGGNPPGGQDRWPGDLAIHLVADPGADLGYEWGVKLGTVGGHNQGDVVYLPDWDGAGYTIPPRPDTMKDGTMPGGAVYTGAAEVAYTDAWLQHPEYGWPTYAIEVKVPKSVIGASGQSMGISQLFIADNCLNEDLYAPEFPTIAVVIASIFGMVFVIYSTKQKRS